MVFIDGYFSMSVRQCPLVRSHAVLLLVIMVGSVVVTNSVVNNRCLNDYIMVDNIMMDNIYTMQGLFREKFMLNNIVMRHMVLLNHNIMVDRLANCVILINDMVFLVTKDAMLSNRGLWVGDSGLMVHVRGRVVHWILSRVVMVLVIHNRLLVDSFIMIGLLIVIENITSGRVINIVIFMEIMQSSILSLVMNVMVNLMSVIAFSVIMVIESMLSGMSMLLRVVLVSKMFIVEITESSLMELRAMMQITVIRVHVFNQGLMVMHCLIVWISKEIVRFLIVSLALYDYVMVQI